MRKRKDSIVEEQDTTRVKGVVRHEHGRTVKTGTVTAREGERGRGGECMCGAGGVDCCE